MTERNNPPRSNVTFAVKRAIVLLFLTAAPALAGMRLELHCRNTSSASYEFTSVALLQEDQVRYDVVEGNHPLFNPRISVITRDRGTTLVIIDHKQRTWFQRKSLGMSGPLSAWKGPGNVSASREWLSPLPVPASVEAPMAGLATQGFAAAISYDLAMKVEGEKLRGKVEARFLVRTIEEKSPAIPWGLEFVLKSGFASVDELIARQLRTRGIPLYEEVRVTRTIEHGPPVTETFVLEVTSAKEETISQAQFLPPEGYEFREPTFGYQ